jgi:type II secretory pathway component GspD/PulD (secretin)
MGSAGGPGGADTAGGVHVLALKHAAAPDLAVVLQQVFPGRSSITAEPRTNQLIIRANQETLLEMAKLIDQLDVEAKKR